MEKRSEDKEQSHNQTFCLAHINKEISDMNGKSKLHV